MFIDLKRKFRNSCKIESFVYSFQNDFKVIFNFKNLVKGLTVCNYILSFNYLKKCPSTIQTHDVCHFLRFVFRKVSDYAVSTQRKVFPHVISNFRFRSFFYTIGSR